MSRTRTWMDLRLTSNALTSGRLLGERDRTLALAGTAVCHFRSSPTLPFVISYFLIFLYFLFFFIFFFFSFPSVSSRFLSFFLPLVGFHWIPGNRRYELGGEFGLAMVRWCYLLFPWIRQSDFLLWSVCLSLGFLAVDRRRAYVSKLHECV